ncbi:MAG: proprotein convertase P-domain-containing protein, partial [Ardenticatenaceae bacterium]
RDATETPEPDDTPEPDETPDGTASPSASATTSGTPGPTATATIFGTPNPYPFGLLSAFFLPNCGLTQIKGTIRDARTNAPVNGVTVRVWYDGAAPDEIYSLPTGADPTRGAGEWDVVLWPGPKEGKWYINVVDRQSGAPLSEIKTLYTDTGPCQPGQSGHQVIIQDFIKYGEGPGVPGITSTATRVPDPSRSPTATRTVTATPTVTPTPTITPTPTPTPVRVSDSVNPDEPVPDYPDGPLVRTLNVAQNVTIRAARVFLNVSHEDIGDLEIRLVHPDGTRVVIHEQGEDQGDLEIRRWIDITGGDLALLLNKPAQGDWELEVLDTIEGRTGTLVSWELEIYP